MPRILAGPTKYPERHTRRHADVGIGSGHTRALAGSQLSVEGIEHVLNSDAEMSAPEHGNRPVPAGRPRAEHPVAQIGQLLGKAAPDEN